MKKYKLLKLDWYKVLSIALFLLLLGAPNVFAAPTPGKVLDSNCSKGEVICILKTSTINTTISIGNFLQSISTSLASGWVSFTYGILNNGIDGVNADKQFATSVINGTISSWNSYKAIINTSEVNTAQFINDSQIALASLPSKIKSTYIASKQLGLNTTASVGDSITSIGNFLQSTSTSLASGWSSFTYGLLNNITDSITGTKEFAVSVGNGAKLIGNGIAEGWTSTENFVAGLFDKKTNSLAVAPIIKTPTPITSIPPPVVSTPTPPIPTEIPTSVEIIPVPQQIIQSGLTGQMGPRGEQGPQGLTGLQGPRGEAGRDGNIVDTSSFVSRTFLDNQVNGIFDSISNSTQGLSSSLSEEVITKLLTVSGNATIGGNITITGNITGNVAGTINPSFTLGSIPFQGATGLAEDNANLFWDKINSRLGIGTRSPSQTFQVGNSLFVNASGNWMGFGALNPSWWQSSGNIWFEGATYFSGGAVLGSSSELTWGNGEQGVNGVDSTGLMFSTGGSEKMRIDNLGNVGIGTTTPSDTLQVKTAGQGSLSFGGSNGREMHAYNSAGNPSNFDMLAASTYFSGNLLVDGNIDLQSGGIFSIERGTNSFELDTMYGGVGTGGPISFVGNSDLRFTANVGSYPSQLYLNTSGNVGIGTTSPRAPLEIYKAQGDTETPGGGLIVSRYDGGGVNYRGGAIYSLALSGFSGYEFGIDALVFGVTTVDGKNPYSDFDQARMVIVANGNVGIGTTTPTQKLDVNGNVNISDSLFVDATANMSHLNLYGSASGLNTAMEIGNNTTPAVGTGSTLDFLAFTSGWSSKVVGRIGSVITDITSSSVYKGALVFYTATNAAPTEKMRINNLGNVGIGTTTPGAKLDVAGLNTATANNTALTGVNFSTTSNYGAYTGIDDVVTRITATNATQIGLVIKQAASPTVNPFELRDSTNAMIMRITTSGAIAVSNVYSPNGTNSLGLGNGTDMTFQTNGLERMRILYTNGNVGIGTTTPGTALHIMAGTNQGMLIGVGDGGATPYPSWMGTNGLLVDGKFKANEYLVGSDGGISWGTSKAVISGHSPTSGVSYLSFYTGNVASYGERMRIIDNGNVGIGTATPGYNLEVVGQNSTVLIRSTDNQGTGNLMVQNNLNAGIDLRFYGSANGGTYAGISKNNLATLEMEDANNNFMTYLPAGTGNLIYATNTLERMRITGAGNVGIGTTNPTSLLQVGGNGGADGSFDVQANLGDSWFSVAGGSIKFNEGGGITTAGNADLGARFNISPVSDSKPALAIRGVTAGVSDLVRVSSPTVTTGDYFIIKSDGNVGIGTTSPGELLSLGLAGTTAGVLSLAGVTSGKVIVQTAAAAGSWTMTLPTAVGGVGQQLTDVAGNGVTSWTSAASSRDLKIISDMPITSGEALTSILNTPVYRFNYKPGKGTGDSVTEYVGVMADEAPWAMHFNGTIINPVNTLGYMILGVQALDKKIVEMNLKLEDLSNLDTTSATSLGSLIKNFLADVTNGITDLYASVIHSDRVETKTLCVGDTCVTEEQFLEMVNKKISNPVTSETPTPPATDMCPNIEGTQKTVPDGMEVDDAGDCVAIVTPPTDICPNIEGTQGTIPSGYSLVDGQCIEDIVTSPIDICPNIDGIQETIPSGMEVDGAGDCVAIVISLTD